jgi:ABC-type branched-subunit amino acid transport system ATPase component
MEIQVKNLGPIQDAKFTLGDFTIICGSNNTGKTYAVYALFGFLETWPHILNFEIESRVINELFSKGSVSLHIPSYLEQAQEILEQGCEFYSQQLYKIFAAPENKFRDAEFGIKLDFSRLQFDQAFEHNIQSQDVEVFSLVKPQNNLDLTITLLISSESSLIPEAAVKSIISNALKDLIFSNYLPHPFIASAERTGAAIFRNELNFARNRLLEEMGQSNKNFDPMELLFKVYRDYALPVKQNVDFTRNLEVVSKEESFLVDQHPEILEDFRQLVGGEYSVRNNGIYYSPSHRKSLKLTMDESSSAVRSLLDIGFYLKHAAQPGDLFIIDEPELNLHPENQRRIARLLARLVNVGIKVCITTHSDYLIKEINHLIMLNRDRPHLQKIRDQWGYQSEELLTPEQMRVYIAQQALISIPGRKGKVKRQTLAAADINAEQGIEVGSFDQTIDQMNQIQEAIIWGMD